MIQITSPVERSGRNWVNRQWWHEITKHCVTEDDIDKVRSNYLGIGYGKWKFSKDDVGRIVLVYKDGVGNTHWHFQ